MDQKGQDLPSRLIALDVFRGATIAAMILVNNPGSWSHVYAQLDHAEWNGWTMTDLIFPFFLFIVGVTTALSRGKLGSSRAGAYPKIVKRAAILFALGLFLNGFPTYDFATIRVMGVLQRIAVCYLAAAILQFELPLTGVAFAAVALLFVYWALMKYYPVPGIGAGVLEKGRNFAAYVDQLVLGRHMWSNTKTWDPEGVVSTIPAISTTLFGVLTGAWLLRGSDEKVKTARLLACGAAGAVIGMAWHVALPINKNLWTSSYAVFMAGLALSCLGCCFYLIEVRKSRWWTQPFLVYGSNSITVFVASGIIARLLNLWKVPLGDKQTAVKNFLYLKLFASWLSPINASLAFAIAFLCVLYVPMWLLYRKKLFIRV